MIAPRILRDSFRYVYLSNSSLFFGKSILEMHSQVQTRLRTRPLQGWECSSVGEHLPNMPGHNSVLTSKTRKSKTPAQYRNQKGGLAHLMQGINPFRHSPNSIKGSAKTGCYVCQRQASDPTMLMCSCNK